MMDDPKDILEAKNKELNELKAAFKLDRVSEVDEIDLEKAKQQRLEAQRLKDEQ